MKKKTLIAIVISLILTSLLSVAYFYYFKPSIDFISNRNIEINSEVKLTDLIKNTKNVNLKEQTINTSSLGKKNVEVNYSYKSGEQMKMVIDVTVVDTTPPVLADIKTYTVIKDIEPLYKEMILNDNSKEEIIPLITGEIDYTKKGTYTLTLKATDSSNNSSSTDFTVEVIEDYSSLKTLVYASKKGYRVEVKNGVLYIDKTLIVNKTYKIPSTYGEGLLDTTKKAYETMKEAALKDGITLTINNSYRSFSYQTTIYNNYVKNNGVKSADTYSARPGHSEHQTGLAMDLNQVSDSFYATKEGKWVNENSYKYGFVIRYPQGKTSYTGYKYEPWHIRYVEKDLAKKLYNDGDWISLEEYYEITSKY